MNFKLISLMAAGALALTACGAASGPVTSPPNTLTAVKVDAVSTDAAAAMWANAPKTSVTSKVPDKKAEVGATVTLQAVYDGKNIAIRAEWDDKTDSWQRNIWTYDGTAWKRAGEQDRLALAFPIGNNAEFASKGCGVICHNQDADEAKWWMGTDSADVRVDFWQWQGASTNPAGYADDSYFSAKATITSTTGRANDANTGGGPKTNAAADGKGPAFMNKSGVDAHYILAGEEVALDMAKVKAGSQIPSSILSKYAGSRGDITAKGKWANGKWVVVMVRALDTGNKDDAAFQPPKAVPFGLGVFDNSGDLEHAVSQDVLTLAWK